MLGLWHDGVVLSLRWCLMFCYVLDVVFAFVSCALVVDRCRVCLSASCARGGLMLCWLGLIVIGMKVGLFFGIVLSGACLSQQRSFLWFTCGFLVDTC